jgi:hypothetical protein
MAGFQNAEFKMRTEYNPVNRMVSFKIHAYTRFKIILPTHPMLKDLCC